MALRFLRNALGVSLLVFPSHGQYLLVSGLTTPCLQRTASRHRPASREASGECQPACRRTAVTRLQSAAAARTDACRQRPPTVTASPDARRTEPWQSIKPPRRRADETQRMPLATWPRRVATSPTRSPIGRARSPKLRRYRPSASADRKKMFGVVFGAWRAIRLIRQPARGTLRPRCTRPIVDRGRGSGAEAPPFATAPARLHRRPRPRAPAPRCGRPSRRPATSMQA